MEFDSRSYAIDNEISVAEVYLLVDYPDHYEYAKIFPFIVGVTQIDGTAIGKSLSINNIYTNMTKLMVYMKQACR